MKRTARTMLKHGAISLGLFVLLDGLVMVRPPFLPEWVIWLVCAVWFLWFVTVALAPFGVGPLGPSLTRAVNADERDSWEQRR
jgi:hypothetical protein